MDLLFHTAQIFRFKLCQGYTTCLQYLQIPPSSPGTIFSLEWIWREERERGEHLAGGRWEKNLWDWGGGGGGWPNRAVMEWKNGIGKLKHLDMESFMSVPLWYYLRLANADDNTVFYNDLQKHNWSDYFMLSSACVLSFKASLVNSEGRSSTCCWTQDDGQIMA